MSEFFRPITISALPLLQQLNDWVIKRNEKRLPKWKFRFAADFAIQIYPRISRANDMLFECLALQTESVTAALFTEPGKLSGRQYYQVRFELRVRSNVWTFQALGGRRWSQSTREERDQVRLRAINVLKPEHFSDLNPTKMLSPQCVCCGRPLIDPVSMARWIGPECWGSASTNLPNIFKAMAA